MRSADGVLRRILLPGAGALEVILLAAGAWWPGAGVPFPLLPLWGAAFLAYLLAAARAGDGRSDRAVIWIVAVLLRLALLPLSPELTDDFHRYLWDGHVQAAGVNPYVHAPADPALDSLATAGRALVNNPEVQTIYPPLAQIAFLLVAWSGIGLLGMKVLWTLLELGAGWALARVAERTGRPVGRVLVLYLWSPLLVVETAWNGHVEALGLAAVSLVLLARGPLGRGAALGLAAAAKLAPAAALPPLLRRGGWRVAAGFAGVVGLLWLPYLGAGSDLVAGLGTYARHWRFLEGPFLVLEAVFPRGIAARAAAAGVVVGVVGWTTLRRFDTERALFWILGAGLLVTPTLHPWYVLWILPFAALRESPPWILLCGLVPLGYWGLGTFLRSGVWPEPAPVRILVWVPVLVLLLREAVRGLRRSRGVRTVGRPGPHPPGEARARPE